MREACEGVPPATQVAALVSLLAREIGRDEAEAFRGSPLTPPQYTVARSLAADGPLMLSDVARVGCCVPGNATGLVDRLERKGLARRVADPADRRVTRVALTPAGERAVAETAARLGTRPDRLAESLPESDLWALVDLLGRLYVALAEPGGEGSTGEPAPTAPRESPGALCAIGEDR